MKLTIEKLVYGGDGLARGDDGRAVFVPFTIPGEEVEATIIQQKPGFARARVERVITPAPGRVEPPCPYFHRCGGCHYQHLPYEQQLAAKQDILRETLHRTAKIDLPQIQAHTSPPWEYRNRTRFHVRLAPEFVLGYFRMGSHALLPVEQCPISSPLLNRALTALWKVGRAQKCLPEISDVEVFADHDDSRLLLNVMIAPGASAPAPAAAEAFTAALDELLPELAGVALFRARGGDAEDAGLGLGALGDAELDYTAAGHRYRVSAGSFFQTNRHLVDAMVSAALAGVESGALALDLYAGVGLFALPLAAKFVQVIAVEASPWSAADLEHNAPPNVRAVRSSTDAYLASAVRKGLRPDMVVVDPPRAGLGPKVTAALAKLRPMRISYVSCDPATLARDAEALIAAGYQVERAYLLDLFPQTFHIESVLHFVL